MRKLFHLWVFSAVIVTIMCGLIYLTVQQNFRQNANDPQIEIAEDISTALSAGEPPAAIGSPSFDLNDSLSPFIAIYDDSGKALAYTATLDGKAPEIPKGVLDSVRKSGEARVTWQPKPTVRQAIVVTRYNDQGDKTSGFVVAGKSLKEIEKRERNLGLEVGAAWVFTLLLSFGMLWGYDYVTNPRPRKSEPESPNTSEPEDMTPPEAK